MQIKRALISVSDKTNLDFLVRELVDFGVEIISTGGTKKYISGLGFVVKDISEFTGFPEILDGRVKTLHPKVHGALLAKRDEDSHISQVNEHNIEFIDLVVVNLYPFAEMLKKGASHEEMIENIDIGGPGMLRSSAKNYKDVAVICDPNDYQKVITELKKNSEISQKTRCELASKVFFTTSVYDSFIQNYLAEKRVENGDFPSLINKTLVKEFELRYGENPHQKAAYYKDANNDVFSWEQLSGKELSYNNLIDLEAAWNIASDFKEKVVVIVKHNNPCGVGSSDNLKNAFLKALSTDPVSAFGGIIATNVVLDKEAALEITNLFTECIIAPGYDVEALEVLKAKKNLRVLKINVNSNNKVEYKMVFSGFLAQEKDKIMKVEKNIITKKNPTETEISDLEFAWLVCKNVKSNAIVLAKNKTIIGIGAGQTSRVDSVEIAISKAQKFGFDLKGAVLASDAFFPFKDSIEMISKYGISSVIQPGGSVRDNEVVECCDQNKISMIFTGERHFKH